MLSSGSSRFGSLTFSYRNATGPAAQVTNQPTTRLEHIPMHTAGHRLFAEQLAVLLVK